MDAVAVSELDFQLIIKENHPEYDLVGEPEFVEEWRHGIAYYQKVKRLSDGHYFHMNYRKELSFGDVFCVGGGGKNEIYVSQNKKSIYNKRGELLTHNHPPKPEPKSDFALAKEKFEEIPKEEIVNINEKPVVPVKDLFSIIKQFSNIKVGIDFNDYQLNLIRLAIKYKVNYDSIHKLAIKYYSSNKKREIKKEYEQAYELAQNGIIKFTLKSGKKVSLDKGELEELKKLL